MKKRLIFFAFMFLVSVSCTLAQAQASPKKTPKANKKPVVNPDCPCKATDVIGQVKYNNKALGVGHSITDIADIKFDRNTDAVSMLDKEKKTTYLVGPSKPGKGDGEPCGNSPDCKPKIWRTEKKSDGKKDNERVPKMK